MKKKRDMEEQIWKNISAVKEKSPLVHNITNFVVMNNTANALLSAGASPVMAHATDEVEDMVKIANALVVNIGTLSQKWVEAMQLAMKQAQKMGKPIIFDPVGVGATPFRNQVVVHLISEASPTVIRGNASEIMAMVSSEHQTKGVDSSIDSQNAFEAAQYLNQQYGSVVCISGKEDIIVSEKQYGRVYNGDSLMGRVTGMGCSATSLIGAFTSVEADPFYATIGAMSYMGVAGEYAAKEAKGPGSFQMAFLDQLHILDEDDFMQKVKVEVTDV